MNEVTVRTMSRTSNRNDEDDMEGNGSEGDGGVPEKNEYEAMRDGNVARIQARLQPALDASKALYVPHYNPRP